MDFYVEAPHTLKPLKKGNKNMLGLIGDSNYDSLLRSV